jgi:hypothetical protein
VTAHGNFEGDNITTMGEFSKQGANKGTLGYIDARDLRIDEDPHSPLIVVENSATVHRTPPANIYLQLEHRDGFFSPVGTFHGLQNGYPWDIQVTREPHTSVSIDVGDGYYTVWAGTWKRT